MDEYILRYVRKALSEDNGKGCDGSNAKYRVVIEMAEVTGGAFVFHVKIPRQFDNELGGTLRETVNTREEAVALLREIIAELEAKVVV